MWARQGNNQETREEKRTGNVEISSGCEVFPTCSLVALFPHECVRESQKEKEAGFVKARVYLREKKSFYFVV